MFGILAKTFNTVLRREEWDAPEHWKQRRLMSDNEAVENDIKRRRAHFGRVGQL